MKNVGIIVLQELKILIKDRQALALLFIMPLALIVFLTFALQDVYKGKMEVQRALTVVTADPCQSPSVCATLVSKFRKLNYDVQLMSEINSASKQDLALILPVQIEATLKVLQEQKELKPEDQVQLLFNPLIDPGTRALVQSHLTLALQGILIERMDQQLSQTPLKKVKLTDVSSFTNLVVQKAFGDVILPNPIQQSVPAWTLFGMFFIVIPLTNSMIRDRHLGVFKRLLSFPVAKWQLIAGKVLPFLFINMIQFFIMFCFGFFALPKFTDLNISLDFSWPGLFLVTIASAMAATSYALLVSCFAKSSEQAHAFGAFSVVILAILGGVMIPRFVMPTFMQDLSVISPLYWGLDAYLDLIVRKLPFTAILPKVALLVGFSLVAAVISSWRFRWIQED